MTDITTTRAKFLENRQKKIDSQNEKIDERRKTTYSGINQPPSPRATDGGAPGTKERHPLEVAAELESDESNQGNDRVPDENSKIADIKSYLDGRSITYPSNAAKAELLALIPAQE